MMLYCTLMFVSRMPDRAFACRMASTLQCAAGLKVHLGAPRPQCAIFGLRHSRLHRRAILAVHTQYTVLNLSLSLPVG